MALLDYVLSYSQGFLSDLETTLADVIDKTTFVLSKLFLGAEGPRRHQSGSDDDRSSDSGLEIPARKKVPSHPFTMALAPLILYTRTNKKLARNPKLLDSRCTWHPSS